MVRAIFLLVLTLPPSKSGRFLFFHKSKFSAFGISTSNVMYAPSVEDTFFMTIPELLPSEKVRAPSANPKFILEVPMLVLPDSVERKAL